jgi:hypothetical protein
MLLPSKGSIEIVWPDIVHFPDLTDVVRTPRQDDPPIAVDAYRAQAFSSAQQLEVQPRVAFILLKADQRPLTPLSIRRVELLEGLLATFAEADPIPHA